MALDFLNKYPYTDFHELNIDWLIESVKKVLEDYQELKTWMENDAANYTVFLFRLMAVEDRTSQLQFEIEAERVRVNEALNVQYRTITDEYTAMYANILTDMTAALNTMSITIDNYKRELIEMINDGDDAVMNWVRATLATFLQTLPDYEHLIINNPVRGMQTTVQIAINDLYDYFNVYGLTAQEYDDLELTAAEYDSYLITAHDYDTFGVKIFSPESYYLMRSPFTGTIEPIPSVIYDLFDLHRSGALTAAAYDALDMTASYYDGLLLDAYDYDLNGI